MEAVWNRRREPCASDVRIGAGTVAGGGAARERAGWVAHDPQTDASPGQGSVPALATRAGGVVEQLRQVVVLEACPLQFRTSEDRRAAIFTPLTAREPREGDAEGVIEAVKDPLLDTAILATVAGAHVQ